MLRARWKTKDGGKLLTTEEEESKQKCAVMKGSLGAGRKSKAFAQAHTS